MLSVAPRLLQRGPPALQRSLDRRLAGFEHCRHLVDAKAENIAQQHGRGLARRHALQAGNKREADRLPLAVASFRSWLRVGDSFEQAVRVRLEPRDLVT